MGSYRRTLSAAVATVLASFALYPIFSGSSWFWGGMGAAIAVAIAGTLTRLRRLPVLVCLIGGVAGLLLYLNLIFTHAQSLLLVIPTPSSLSHLWHLAGQGISQSRAYAPPVPELDGMILLATGGIGLAALMVDLIAVRLRSAALAGLPLLLLFTEPFTLSVSRGWLGTTLIFCLATAGYLTLLGSEGRERIRDWEQPQPGQTPARAPGRAPDTRALTAAGRRVGAASVVVALCVPLFVPGLHFTRLFGGGAGIGTGAGSGAVGFPDLQTQLGGELRESAASPVLTYTTSAATPAYLQVYVLDNLTSSGWQPFNQRVASVPVNPKLPPAPGLTDTAGASAVTTNITVGKNVAQDTLSALPTPYPAAAVHATGGNLQADPANLMVFDIGAQLAGLSYTVTSEGVAPSEQALAAAPPPPGTITSHYLEVPAGYDALRSLARSVTDGAKTPFAEAVALQNWFADGNFAYSLNSPAITNETGLANFLTTTRTGYCQQFSFAMAVLARLLGIPSQVVYGFTQGTHDSGDRWTVTTHDAHAWPELYFQGFGWLRFEPTPGGPTGQGTALTPAYTRAQSGPSTSSSANPSPDTSSTAGATGTKNGQSASNRNRFANLGNDGGGTTVTHAAGGPSPWELTGLSLLGLLALVVIVPGCTRLVIRQRRWRMGARAGDAGLAQVAWLELRDDLTDYGAGYNPSETPRALAARVAAAGAAFAPVTVDAVPAVPARGGVFTPDGAFAPNGALAPDGAADGAADAPAGVATLVSPAELAGAGLAGEGLAGADLAGDGDLIGEADLVDVAELADLNGNAADLDPSADPSTDPGAALRRVAMAAERARYSARPASGATLRQDSATVRRAIAASASRRTRWQARIFPSSVVAPVAIAVSQATDAFGRLNLSRIQYRDKP